MLNIGLYQNKKIGKIITFLIAVITMSILMCLPAFAETPASLKIPVTVQGNENESYEVRITGQETEFASIDHDNLSLKGGRSGSFTMMCSYSENYHYEIRQNKGTSSSMNYDGTIYKADIYVTEEKDGSLVAHPVLYKEGSTRKEQTAAFINKKKETPQSESGTKALQKTAMVSDNPQTGDDTPMALIITFLCTGLVLLLAGVVNTKKGGKNNA